MALHAARPLMREPFAGAFLLRAVLIAVAFLPFTLGVSGCSPYRAEMVTGYSYWAYPHNAYGRVLSYDASTCTAVVALNPDSEVLLEYPDGPDKTLKPEWVFYSEGRFNGEDVVTLYCEDEAGGKYELPVGPLQRNAFVDVSMWLGRDGKGRLKCERIEVIDVSDVDSLFVRDFAEKRFATDHISTKGSSWWQFPNLIPNRDFDRGIY